MEPESQHWLLDEHKVPYEATLMEWAVWFEVGDKVVKQTDLPNYHVSTVFLGLDHNYSGTGDPEIFETMVFKQNDCGECYCERCATWDQALEQHEVAVDLYRP